VRHAAPTPIVPAPLSGKRERAVIAKENNFAQPGERFRSWDAARQERFISRMADILGDKRCTQVRAEHLACSRWPKMLLPCMVVCHVPGFLL
jgi:catalase